MAYSRGPEGAAMQGGVRQDIALGVVDADTAALTSAMDASMTGENRRRELASQRPGQGAQIPLPQPVSGPGIGIADVPGLEVAGAGYSVPPESSPAQVAAYTMPVYAPDAVGGLGFQAGMSEPAISAFTGSRSAPADGIAVVSPPSRPSLLSRVLGRLRRG